MLYRERWDSNLFNVWYNRGIEQISSLGNIPDGIFNKINADEDISIGDVTVHPFRISHDANEPVAYTFTQKCADGIKKHRL